MNDIDDLRRAWETMKTELREVQPFKALYAAAIWTVNAIETIIERIGGNRK